MDDLNLLKDLSVANYEYLRNLGFNETALVDLYTPKKVTACDTETLVANYLI